MFYSHEILTSRKHGVATVWVVATLGAKSNTKKVGRKAIIEVNVRKACETIMQPEAPMALRLQSNLLYGVLKVYDYQCSYILADAQQVEMKIRNLFKPARNNDLAPDARKARPDQLMLMDDPAFLPDMALPALDFDIPNLEIAGNSHRSSQSMMSVRRRSGSAASQPISLPGLNLPSSSINGGAYQLPTYDPFAESSAMKPFGGTGRLLFDDEEGVHMEDDAIFEFDDNGEIRDIDINEREARRLGSVYPSGLGRLETDSGANGRVRKEHEDAAAGRVLPLVDGEGFFDTVNFGGEDIQMLPEAEPFPMMSGGLGGSDRPNPLLESEDKVFSAEPSSVSAEAPIKRCRSKTKKKLAMDQNIELRSGDLIRWQREYLDNMAEATAKKNNHKEFAQAKKNAEHFILGQGLNGVGEGVGSSRLQSPLFMFAGASLLEKITGQTIPAPIPKGKKGTKRAAPVDADKAPSTPLKRVRPSPQFEDEIGRGHLGGDDAIMMMGEEDITSGIEVGREAPNALPDLPSSTMMPWNISASLHSHQRGASSSIPGSRAGRRPTSASPLMGRGSNLPGELEHFSQELDHDAMVLYGRSDHEATNDDDAGFARGGPPHGLGISPRHAEFEIFGPAAQVDTQTAGSSQWVRDALDLESDHFFEYVRNSISEKTRDDLADDDDGDGEEKCVTFEELFDPHRNSRMVAAQAFYHVLSLATKKRVWVEQDVDEVSLMPFGEIRIGILS